MAHTNTATDMTVANTDMMVANTILAQLGGMRFIVMTGSKDFIGGDNFLMFKIGTGARNGINKVRVTLEACDTYKVEFYNIRGAKFKTISEITDVYCDQLRAVFTRHTGFETSL